MVISKALRSAAGYIKGLLQRGEGCRSTTAQIEAMRRFAAEQGLVVIALYVDEGSGRRGLQRAAFQRLVNTAQSNRIFEVLVWNRARFRRDRSDDGVD